MRWSNHTTTLKRIRFNSPTSKYIAKLGRDRWSVAGIISWCLEERGEQVTQSQVTYHLRQHGVSLKEARL